jgi:O-antigen/teichoic acid export membrane protein
MKALLARIRRSAFIKNVFVLITGTALSQAIIILAAPVLSRLFSPTAFGVMSVVFAVSSPLAVMAGMKYELAIVLAKDDKDASNIFILTLALVLFISTLTLLCIPFVGEWIAFHMERPQAAPLMVWIPAMVLVSGLFNVVLFWANRRKDYIWTSASMIARSVGTVVVQVILGLADRGAKGLIFGRVFGVILAVAVLGVHTLKNEFHLILSSFDMKRLREMAREHDQFPKYAAPKEMIVALSGSVPSIFLALMFSPAAAGLYWFTVRLLEAPTNLVGIAVRRVFYERAAKALHAKERIYPHLMQATAVLAAMGVVPVLLIIVEGPDIFDIAFGDEWRGAGVYARWLTLWWYSSFCFVACSALVPVFRVQRLFLGIEIVGVILRAAAITAAVFFGNDVLAIALYSLIGFLLNVYRIYYVVMFAKHRQHEVPV